MLFLSQRPSAAGFVQSSVLAWCVFWAPGSLEELRGRVVRPAEQNTYDAAHVFFNDGIFNHELAYFLSRLSSAGIRFNDIMSACAIDAWTFPAIWAAGRKVLKGLFDQKRERSMRDNQSFGSGPTEMLFAIPFLSAFVDLGLNSDHKRRFSQEIDCLRAMCQVVGAMKRAKVGDLGAAASADALRVAMGRHAEAYKASYAGEPTAYLPKWHVQWHLIGQILRDSMLLDTMPAERKHSVIRTVAAQVQHTSTFERSVVARALVTTLHDMQELDAGDGLRGPRADPELDSMFGLPAGSTFSATARYQNVVFSSGDIVFLGGAALCVDAFCAQPGHRGILMLARPCTCRSRISETMTKWRVGSEAYLRPLAEPPLLAEMWRWESDHDVLVVAY